MGILRDELVARPLAEWNEEDGTVLWWAFPITEAPYVGSPLDLGHTVEIHTQDTAEGPRVAARTTIGGWPGYHTHWTRIIKPLIQSDVDAQAAGEAGHPAVPVGSAATA